MMIFGARKGGSQSQIRYDGIYNRSKPNEIRVLTTVIAYDTTENQQNFSFRKASEIIRDVCFVNDLLLMRKIYASPGGTAIR